MSLSPLIKWAGGKRQLVEYLRPLIDERRSYGGTYFEPFLGGGAVALSLDEDVPVVACDVSDELMDFWLTVRDHPARLSATLERYRENHSSDQYYRVRSSLGFGLAERAARFLYLNKMGFNGLYRKNQSGGFNVPLGRGKPSALPTYGDLVAVSSRLKRSWHLSCGDFEEVIEAAREGDVVFADPPYDGTHDYSSGFGDADRKRLSDSLRRAARRGVGVVACDADTRLTRGLYGWWADVRGVSESRRISAKSDQRERAACIVAVRP